MHFPREMLRPFSWAWSSRRRPAAAPGRHGRHRRAARAAGKTSMAKAKHAGEARKLSDIPNIGPAMVADFRDIGIERPAQLRGKDPYALYERLCTLTGTRHDPCVIDTFISAVRFMEGAPPRPWWHYTPERKRRMAAERG